MTRIRTGLISGTALLALLVPSLYLATQDTTPTQFPASPDVVSSVQPSVVLSPTENTATPTPSDGSGTWVQGQVLVTPHSPDELLALAEQLGATVVRQGARSGLAVLATPPGMTDAAFLSRLREDGAIRTVARHARMVGAADDPPFTEEVFVGASDITPTEHWGKHTGKQWHHHDSENYVAQGQDFSGVVVAVLDTGVAYEDYTGADGTVYVQAPSLVRSPIVAPYDFVNGDTHANDDHQHGTHIASVIASHGDVVGSAPGVSLMPLKVLDSGNSGYEIDLIEAIYWAADNGADVINMSLSFGEGYAPSPGLLEAIDYAHSDDVVLVAASGNEALAETSWPARSPQVIAVTGHCMDSDGEYVQAPYANGSPAVDISAPGGCLDRDVDQDGMADGIIAETIAMGQPDQIGYWSYAGTSQAAAQVSGVVARMIDERDRYWMTDSFADVAAMTLQYASWYGSHRTSRSMVGDDGYAIGIGAGKLDARYAERFIGHSGLKSAIRNHNYAVAMMPYLLDNGDGTVSPAINITAHSDTTHASLDKLVVHGNLLGSTAETFSCALDIDGRCSYIGPAIAASEDDALAWTMTVDAVSVYGIIADRPDRLLFASDELESVVSAMQVDDSLDGAVLGFHWGTTVDEELGSVREALSFTDTGTGVATSPFTILLTPPALPPGSTVGEVGLEGTGVATSPFVVTRVKIPPHDPVTGEGIEGLANGLVLAALQGTGIATSPFIPKVVLDPPDPDPEPIVVGAGVNYTNVDLSQTALGVQLDAGGWTTPSGIQGASALASGVLAGQSSENELGAGSNSLTLD